MKKFRHFIAILATLAFVAHANADHHLKPVKLDGVWKAKASTENGERDLTWTIKKKGGKLTGTSMDWENGDERTFDRIMIKEKDVTMEIDVEQDGVKGVIRVEVKEKAAGKLDGKWSVVADDGTEYMSGDITAMKEVQFAGEWDAVSVLPDGQELESVLKLEGKNKKLEGVLDGDAGELELDKVVAKNGGLHVEFEFEMNGTPIEVTIKAKPEGDNKLVGEWSVPSPDGEVSGEWSAVRKPKGLAGVWNYVADTPEGEYKGVLTLEMKNGKYAGSTKSDDGDSTDLESAKVNGKSLEFEFPFKRDDVEGTIVVELKLQDDGSLKGQWVLEGEDGTEFASDSYKATRKE